MSTPQTDAARSADAPILALLTCADKAEARRLAGRMVEDGLAACAQLTLIESVYMWNGKVEEAQEVVVTLKTTRARFAEIKAVVAHLHSYDTPALVATQVIDGGDSYIAWIKATVRGGGMDT